jgi:hypothetical protein
MDPTEPLPRRRRTAWHPLFVRALRRAAPRPYFRVDAEFPLSQEPLRLDTVVVRREALPPSFRPPFFEELVTHLGEHTLIELKSATDSCDWTDLLRLLACAALCCIESEVKEPERVRLMAVAPHMTESLREQLGRRRGTATLLGPGTWEVRGMDHLLYCIETEEVSDHVLHVFSRSFLRDPMAVVPLLTVEERAMVIEIFGDVKQFRQDQTARLRYADYDEVAMSLEQFMEALVEKFPPEIRVKGLAPEDRMKGLAPEELIEGLSPEERQRLLEILLAKTQT